MKVSILAGGLGTRLTEETTNKPKPMVTIGGQPMLWHIMKLYASFGYNEFVIALGYKGSVIKDYFTHYFNRSNNLTINLKKGEITVHQSDSEDWTVHLLDTGLETATGGRVKKIAEFIGNERFHLTYGDSIGNIDLKALLSVHESNNAHVTVTAVHPPARFGAISIKNGTVTSFAEKPQSRESWINGGFFVVESSAIDYIANDSTAWESYPLEQLAKEKKLFAYEHDTFWQCMDTLRDVKTLEDLWNSSNPPWKIWT